METRPLSFYAKAIRPSLPKHAFDAVPSRLAWLALHVTIVVGSIVALKHHVGGWWAAPLWALLIGSSFGGLAFVGHETMHGAVVRNRIARQLIGWVCFAPFLLSSRLWVAWHNKTHHGNTMRDGRDPDAFPTMETYRTSVGARIADRVALAHDRPLGFLTLLFGFTGQSSQMLLLWSPTTDALIKRDRVVVAFEVLSIWSLWATVLWLVGPALFFFAFVVPNMIGNAIVMSYILTNHNLSPLTEINDPLVNSLSVEVPEIVHRLHLHFGLHVEHHLFPSMSSAYAPLVRDALRAQFPDRYQSMTLVAAVRALMSTPRVYATATRLVDPKSGYEVDTLLPMETTAQSAAA